MQKVTLSKAAGPRWSALLLWQRQRAAQAGRASAIFTPRQAREPVVVARPRQLTGSHAAVAGPWRHSQEPGLDFFVALPHDAVMVGGRIGREEALKAGLKAMKALGVMGVSLDVHWSLVETAPQQYSWAAYQKLLQHIKDVGLKARVNLCFHAVNEQLTLPGWVLDVGASIPDIFYTDKANTRSQEYLTLGIDELPVLRGRTALQCYADFARSFRNACSHYLGTTVQDVVVSTGPSGCSQYPAHPRIGPNQRWTFPGIGEFQCYDKFMLSRLRAVAQQASQPQWGLSGPHDAGSYCQWPHQTGFFSHTGSWDTAYGRFFLQLYSEMLLLHVDQVLGHVASALAAPGLGLHIKVPGNHWWYHHSAHPSELTAGIYNTVHRDGYLQLFKVAAGHGAGVVLTNADLRNHGQHGQALCGPEDLLRQQRTVAAALQLAVTVENAVACACDDTSLQSLQATLFERVSSQGIDLPMPNTLLFHTMAPSLFEPAEWNRFKGFARDVLARSNPAGADVARARSSTGASAGSAPAAEQVHVSDALLMAAAGGGGGAGAAPAGMASMWG